MTSSPTSPTRLLIVAVSMILYPFLRPFPDGRFNLVIYAS
jgi:hypothetical protein